MPPPDITNPDVIRYLLENYEAEEKQRLDWFNKHQEKIQQAATLQREPTNYTKADVLAYTMKEGLPTIIRDHKTSALNRMQVPAATPIPRLKDLRHGHSVVDIGLGDPNEDPRLIRPDTELTPDPIMRPVDPNISKIIYKPKPGRERYIRERNKLKPEDKYYFPECTNWLYGWRLKDNVLPNKSEYCNYSHFTGTKRGKVGPQPDPPYYKSADIPGSSKCKHYY